MRRVTCSRSGRRRCAWTWVLQRSVIHDIIKLLNGDAGLWVGVVTGTRRHTLSPFLWTCFDVLSQPRGNYDAFGVGCSTGREWLLLPEGTAGPRSSAPSTSSSSCWSELLRIYHRRSGRHMQAGKTHDSCIYSSLFSVNASGRARGCCGVVLRRGAGGPRGVHNLCKTQAIICFRSVTPCCLCCFDFEYLGAVTRSVFVLFRA